MVRATVLIPTHSHGPLLRLAATSALRQTITDLELFIVLDGADPATTEAAADVAEGDSRVRLFRHQKGARHGEAYRHLALQEARGNIVCYLCDDDLWFPDHIEYLEGLLRDSDFAHSQTLVARPRGGAETPYIGDLADPWYREAMLGRHNFIPLSAAGHTLAAYRSLGVEWSPAPADVWTDLFMWRKFLALPHARLVTGGQPTVLHFPSPARVDMSVSARLAELESWTRSLDAPGAWEALRLEGIGLLNASAARLQKGAVLLDAELNRVQAQLAESEHTADDLRAAHSSHRAELAAAVAEIDRLTAEHTDHLKAAQASHRAELAAAVAEIDRLTAERTAIRGSVAYRAAYRLGAIPFIGRVARWVGRALAGRAAR